MRNLLDLIENNSLLTESSDTSDDLTSMKQAIAAKIKELPLDDITAKALKEIEDLLKHVHAGGRMGIINGELKAINDPTVDDAQRMLARYILSLDQTPAQRDELFKLWREDKLIDSKKLITPGKKSFSDIVTSFNSNPLIKELVTELMHISALGQGKGEFGLSVLSKKIHKQEGKGDLSINGHNIEVKTTDGGAGRFTDQEVRPAAGYEKAARDLNNFVLAHPNHAVKLPKSGVNMSVAIDFARAIQDPKERKQYMNMVKHVITLIFGGTATAGITKIMTAIESGNLGAALQEYAKESFNYYMSKKKDEGVLYITLLDNPISTIYFTDADELSQSSLRLHAGTPYITSIADVRLPYPQIEIVTTTFGANARAQAEKTAKKHEHELELALKREKRNHAPVVPKIAKAVAAAGDGNDREMR